MDYVVLVRPSCRHSPSDEWDYMSHSQNDGNSANHVLASLTARVAALRVAWGTAQAARGWVLPRCKPSLL
eukprot:4321121-Pleurochrysis_carterae.AAC.1